MKALRSETTRKRSASPEADAVRPQEHAFVEELNEAVHDETVMDVLSAGEPARGRSAHLRRRLANRSPMLRGGAPSGEDSETPE